MDISVPKASYDEAANGAGSEGLAVIDQQIQDALKEIEQLRIKRSEMDCIPKFTQGRASDLANTSVRAPAGIDELTSRAEAGHKHSQPSSKYIDANRIEYVSNFSESLRVPKPGMTKSRAGNIVFRTERKVLQQSLRREKDEIHAEFLAKMENVNVIDSSADQRNELGDEGLEFASSKMDGHCLTNLRATLASRIRQQARARETRINLLLSPGISAPAAAELDSSNRRRQTCGILVSRAHRERVARGGYCGVNDAAELQVQGHEHLGQSTTIQAQDDEHRDQQAKKEVSITAVQQVEKSTTCRPERHLKTLLGEQRAAMSARERTRRHRDQNLICHRAGELLEQLKVETSRINSPGFSVDAALLGGLATKLEGGLYQLMPRDVIRCINLAADAAKSVKDLTTRSQDCMETLAVNALNRLARCAAAVIAVAILDEGTAVVAEALAAIAKAGAVGQECTDACVSRLIVLMKTAPKTLTPALMARISVSLSRLESCGDLATFFTGSRSQKFMWAFREILFASLPEFLEDDLGVLASGSIKYIEEHGMRRFFYRAAQLKVGLTPSTKHYLQALVKLEDHVRLAFPTVMSALPELARQYCFRLRDTRVGD